MAIAASSSAPNSVGRRLIEERFIGMLSPCTGVNPVGMFGWSAIHAA
jgi:hypothetical protein